MANIFAYMRISTKEDRDKQSFTRQEHALNQYIKRTNKKYLRVFRDDRSGKSFQNRDEWNELEEALQSGDTVVMKSVDRFTRNTDEGLKKYMSLMQKGVNLIFLDNPTLSTDYMKNLLNIAENQPDRIARESLAFIAKILLIAELDRAEKERETISKRTKDGMEAHRKEAESKGLSWAAGRKRGQLDKMTPELEADIKSYLADRSVKGVDVMKKHKIARNTFTKYVEHVKQQPSNNARA